MPTYEFYNKKTKETFTKVLPMDKRNEPCRDPNVEKVISVPKMITISDLGGKEDKLREDISQKADAGLKAKGKDRNGAKKNRWIQMAKSTVNKAGNYTKPGMRKKIFNRIKAQASHGTAAGQWSARKAQALAKAYKKAGGGYK